MAYYIHNEEKNGIEIYFDGKPSVEVISELKSNSWRWFPLKRCWYNYFSEAHEDFAKEICDGSHILTTIKKSEIKPIEKVIVAENSVKSTPRKRTSTYKTSKLRKDSSLIERDYNLEKSFGIDDINYYYFEKEDDVIYITGEIFSQNGIEKKFKFICTLYDKDGDIIETSENMTYGDGVVTHSIEPKCFFNGFPFQFFFWGTDEKISRIKIIPVE